MKKVSKLFLNFLFVFGIILAFYTLIKVYYLDKKNLLEGLCPVTNNRNLIYISIFVLFSYFILSSIYDRKNK